MPQHRSHLAPSAGQSELAAVLAGLHAEYDSPFPAEATAEAEQAAASAPELDLRDIPFATLDPLGSRDLDQAFHLERGTGGGKGGNGAGYTVRYAIADVPGFVRPEGALDTCVRGRGQTLYAADGSIPLHPSVLSEGAASLLPDVDRPALVWTFALDEAGVVTDTRLERALIRSRAQLDYVSTQAELDNGGQTPGSELAALLPEIGKLRIAQEAARGGASLNMPDTETIRTPDGGYGLERRNPLPVEDWNAQLSLMTGMAAATIMLDAGIGVLRTMPQPDDEQFETFRRRTQALGRPWESGRYGDYLRTLDLAEAMTLPILDAASALFRGAGYEAFDGTAPESSTQAAIGAPYAHVTAPLRRLVDRWGLAICLAVSEGRDVPGWARESMAELPKAMQKSSSRASQLNSRTIDAIEAALLTPRRGEVFDATIVRLGEGGEATVQLVEPAVTTRVTVPATSTPGSGVRLRLEDADVSAGTLAFSVV